MKKSQLKSGHYYILQPDQADKFTRVGIPFDDAKTLCDGRPHLWDGDKFDCWRHEWCFDNFEAIELVPNQGFTCPLAGQTTSTTPPTVPHQETAFEYAKRTRRWLAKDGDDNQWFAFSKKPTLKEGHRVWFVNNSIVDSDMSLVYPDVAFDKSLITPNGEFYHEVKKPKVVLPKRGDPIFVWDNNCSDAIPCSVMYFHHIEKDGDVRVFSSSREGAVGFYFDKYRRFDPKLVGVPRKDWPAE